MEGKHKEARKKGRGNAKEKESSKQIESTRDESLGRGSREQKVTVERNKKGSGGKRRGTKYKKKEENE